MWSVDNRVNGEIELLPQFYTHPVAGLLPKSEKSAVAGCHYAPAVLYVPNCTLSPCGEQLHEWKKKNKGSVSHVPESSCFSKEMIADPFRFVLQ